MSAAVELLSGLARNNEWANRRLHRACAKLPREEYRATRTSFFPSIHLTLNHILLIDRYYYDCIAETGRAASRYDEFESGVAFEELAELAAAQAEMDARLVAFCDDLDEAALARRVVTPRPGGRMPQERIDALLLHLFEHQIHHRGQAHAMLAGTRIPPPQLDEFFLDQDAPARAQDA
jgi:uncharacterized damage-inducible protein DinB